jgi:hypothetical protein
MEFFDNEVVFNTSLVNKGLFQSSPKHIHHSITQRFESLGRKQYQSKRHAIYCGLLVFETMEKVLLLTSDVLPALFNVDFRTRFSKGIIFKETCLFYKSDLQ